jgi:integrase/recombinase XerD
VIETQRRNHVVTRNQRLAALHTFYRYLAVHYPEILPEAERVEAIPSKRCSAPKTIFLERENIDAIFDDVYPNHRQVTSRPIRRLVSFAG